MAVSKCLKYLLFLFNLLFWISGCIILGVGIYLRVSKDGSQVLSNVFPTDKLPSFDLMIAIGVIIMVLGFLGCVGAYKESRILLILFFIFLLIIFVLLLAAGILAAVSQDNKEVKNFVRDKLKALVPLSSQSDGVKQDLEKLQRELKCCGLINGPQDWSPPPPSCRCNATESEPCSNAIYQEPCVDKIITYVENHLEVALGIAFAIAGLLLFGMIFSMVIICQISRKTGATQ